jgi:hypothetical protein
VIISFASKLLSLSLPFSCYLLAFLVTLGVCLSWSRSVLIELCGRKVGAAVVGDPFFLRLPAVLSTFISVS